MSTGCVRFEGDGLALPWTGQDAVSLCPDCGRDELNDCSCAFDGSRDA